MSNEKHPQLDADDMPDLRDLSREELTLLPGDTWKMYCCIHGCNRYTRVRDVAAWPRLISPTLNIKFINVDVQVFFCGTHYKQFKHIASDKTPFKAERHIDKKARTIWKDK